jgi:hypothetical protein
MHTLITDVSHADKDQQVADDLNSIVDCYRGVEAAHEADPTNKHLAERWAEANKIVAYAQRVIRQWQRRSISFETLATTAHNERLRLEVVALQSVG